MIKSSVSSGVRLVPPEQKSAFTIPPMEKPAVRMTSRAVRKTNKGSKQIEMHQVVPLLLVPIVVEDMKTSMMKGKSR